MKIYYLSGTAIPSRAASALHVMKMARAFQRLGHRITVLAFSNDHEDMDPFLFYGMDRSFDLVRFRPSNLPHGLGYYFAARCLLYCAKHGLPRAFYGRHSQALMAASLTKRPVAYEAHGLFPFKGSRWIESMLYRRPNFKGLVTITQALAEDYMTALPWLGNRNQWVIPDAADIPEKGGTAADRWPGRPGVPQIGYVGHLYKGKGMEVVTALAQSLGEYDFHVVGGRDMDIQRWREVCKAPNLFFHGFVQNHLLNGYYNRFHLALLPYQYQVMLADDTRDTGRWMSPLKAFEYMSYGLPIISSDTPVLREIFKHERNALLVDPRDITAWERAIKGLLKDKSLRMRLGDTARTIFLQKYTWEQRAQKIVNILKEVSLQ
jgi:glycosyltransferase involved in cell wall biosynthesis